MKKICLVLLVFVLSGCGGVNNLRVKTPEELSSLNHSIAALVAPTTTDDLSSHRIYCTGTFISEEVVLTAAHCVDDPIYGEYSVLKSKVRVGTYKDYRETGGAFSSGRYHAFEVIAFKPSVDLALLKLVPGEYSFFHREVMYLSPVAPVTGENVSVIGHPNGLGWTLTHGVVSQGKRAGWGAGTNPIPFIQHSAQVYYGNSGGPVINSDNELVGVVSQGGPWHIGMSVHLSAVKEFVYSELI